jgi:hypothetical protein
MAVVAAMRTANIDVEAADADVYALSLNLLTVEGNGREKRCDR